MDKKMQVGDIYNFFSTERGKSVIDRLLKHYKNAIEEAIGTIDLNGNIIEYLLQEDRFLKVINVLREQRFMFSRTQNEILDVLEHDLPSYIDKIKKREGEMKDIKTKLKEIDRTKLDRESMKKFPMAGTSSHILSCENIRLLEEALGVSVGTIDFPEGYVLKFSANCSSINETLMKKRSGYLLGQYEIVYKNTEHRKNLLVLLQPRYEAITQQNSPGSYGSIWMPLKELSDIERRNGTVDDKEKYVRGLIKSAGGAIKYLENLYRYVQGFLPIEDYFLCYKQEFEKRYLPKVFKEGTSKIAIDKYNKKYGENMLFNMFTREKIPCKDSHNTYSGLYGLLRLVYCSAPERQKAKAREIIRKILTPHYLFFAGNYSDLMYDPLTKRWVFVDRHDTRDKSGGDDLVGYTYEGHDKHRDRLKKNTIKSKT